MDANQAVAVARVGARSQMIGRAGSDLFGAIARDRLDELGVGRDHLIFAEHVVAGVAQIKIDARGENCVIVIGDANMTVDQAMVDHAETTLRAAPVLLVQL